VAIGATGRARGSATTAQMNAPFMVCRLDSSEQLNRGLIACREHIAETLLRAAQPPRRIARAIRRHTRPTTYFGHLEATKVHTALVLEATACTARSTTHLLVPNTAAANRRTATTLRRLRHPVAECERQHGRRHGHGHGRCCGEQPLCLRRLWQERVWNLCRRVGKEALSGMRDESQKLRAVLVTVNLYRLSLDEVLVLQMAFGYSD
jgi:hypothetical protein